MSFKHLWNFPNKSLRDKHDFYPVELITDHMTDIGRKSRFHSHQSERLWKEDGWFCCARDWSTLSEMSFSSHRPSKAVPRPLTILRLFVFSCLGAEPREVWFCWYTWVMQGQTVGIKKTRKRQIQYGLLGWWSRNCTGNVWKGILTFLANLCKKNVTLMSLKKKERKQKKKRHESKLLCLWWCIAYAQGGKRDTSD